MSLQVWLPLNGTLDNQGLAGDCVFTNSNTTDIVIDNNGKIGKCYSFSALSGKGIFSPDNGFMDKYINGKSSSVCYWIKTNVTNNCPLHLSYGYRVLIGSNGKPSLSLYNSTKYVSVIGSINICDNNWHHIATTYDNITGNMCIYIDGIKSGENNYGTDITYSSSWDNGLFIGRDPNNSTAISSYFFQGSLNDIRIYDHALSPKEVHEISKGLCIHYPFRDPYIEKTINIAKYPTPSSSYHPGWDDSKHEEAISVGGWFGGYNSGVANPNIGYHACWRLIDDIPTIVFQDKNSEIGITHRWLGMASTMSDSSLLGPGVTYTISFDAKADVEGKQVSTGIYYRKTDNSTSNFYDGCTKKTLTTEWKRYSWTYTSGQTYDITGESFLYIYGHYGTEGTSYVRNIQLETKDHASPYTPNYLSADSDNLVASLSPGGQTTISGLNVTTSGANADTYFYLNLTEPLIEGQQYTVSCIGENIPDNTYWGFAIGDQNNTRCVMDVRNGLNTYTFVSNDKTSNKTQIILDDNYRADACVNRCIFKNINIVKSDIIYDSSGYGHNANLNGNIQCIHSEARNNMCTHLKSTNVGVSTQCGISYIKSNISLYKPKQLTVSFWLNYDSVARGGIITSSSLSTPSDYTVTAFHQYDNTLRFNDESGNNIMVTFTSFAIAKEWHYYTFVFDGRNIKLYRDGTELTNISNSFPSDTSLPTFDTIYLGYSYAGGLIRQTNSKWSDFRIYSTALSADDIKELYEASAHIDNHGNVYGYELKEE